MNLHEMPNLGPKIVTLLNDINIKTSDDLIKIGSKETFIKIHYTGEGCLNMLYAIEGAIRGVRWHYLPDDVKQDLKIFYKTIQGGTNENS